MKAANPRANSGQAGGFEIYIGSDGPIQARLWQEPGSLVK